MFTRLCLLLAMAVPRPGEVRVGHLKPRDPDDRTKFEQTHTQFVREWDGLTRLR